MKETNVVEPDDVPAVGFDYIVEIPGKKQLIFHSHVAQTVTPEALNAVLDKLRDAAARQYWYELIDVLTLEYQNHKRIAVEHANRMHLAETTFKEDWIKRNRRGDPRLSEMEQKQKHQAEAHLQSAKDVVVQARKKLLDAYAKAGMEPPTDLD